MNKRTAIRRNINSQEALVIRQTLVRTSTLTDVQKLDATIEELIVVGKCDCGCDSIDFMGHGEVSGITPIADGIGITPKSGKVGVIVWGTAHIITGLEIYDLGAGSSDLKLPTPESIQSFES